MVWFNFRVLIVFIVERVRDFFFFRAYAGRISTSELVNRLFNFCEVYSGKVFYKYQEQMGKRYILSVLENDGEEITGLFSRQSGKTETIATVTGGLMIILPRLANMPMFLNDPRFAMFRDGFWVGIFAPSMRQSQITYNRMRSRMQSKEAQAVLSDPDFNLEFSTSNGTTVSLTNGSYCMAISASDNSNIEGETFKVLILEECFVKGTPVHCQYGYKNIEDIKVGEKVYSFNHDTNKVELKTVVRSFSQPLYGRKMVTIYTESGRKIECTDNHKIYVIGVGYVRADSLYTGDLLLGYNSRQIREEIAKIEIHEINEIMVYDLTVEDNHNFFANSYLVHNCQDISNFKIQKCLTGDTRVLLSSGEYKTLKDVVNDKKDKIVCFDSNMIHQVCKYPIEYYDNGVQDVYEVLLDNGSSIKATLNHQFYTLNKKTRGTKCKFRTLSDIVDSMGNDRPLRIAVPDKLPYFAKDSELDYEKGLIIGYFMGDGCVVGTPKFIGDIPTCNRLHSLIKEVCGEVKMTIYNYNEDNGMQEVCFSTPTNRKNSNPLTIFLKEFGLYGCTGINKKLPDNLFSKEFYRGYIESLIETDGCVESYTTKPIISFANISKDMVEQLRDIYLKFGIHSTLFQKENKDISENSKLLYLVHVKSVLDIRRFYNDIVLFRKQCYLNEAVNTIKNKKSREVSKYYSGDMRFCKVKSVKYIGKEHTYCLKVEGRNFIANNMISSNSIHPMGAAYNATIIKIGTPTTFKGDFYETIQRNKKKDRVGSKRNHFEYNYKVVQKYNPKYKKYVEKEKERLGETSDSFRMSYNLEWILSRGMFIDIEEFEKLCGEDYLERVDHDVKATHVAGLDIGGGSSTNKKEADSTVCTIVEVDWDSPVLMESSHDYETGQDIVYMAYNTYIKDWLELSPEIAENYEEQYGILMEYFKRWKLARLVCDATREASLSQRIAASVNFEVVPFVFGTKSKSDLYKHLQTEIKTGRARYPNGPETQETEEFKKFIEQMSNLQKGYRGADMVVSHPDEKGAHDDYTDSWALGVFAAKDAGQVDETETKERMDVMCDRRYVSNVHSRSHYLSMSATGRRNMRTARRR